LATKKKKGLHFLTWASFMEASVKTESNSFKTFMSFIPLFAYVSGVVYNTERGEK